MRIGKKRSINVRARWGKTTINKDKGEDTDEWALENGYVSVVPVQFDLTAHHAIKDINSWKL